MRVSTSTLTELVEKRNFCIVPHSSLAQSVKRDTCPLRRSFVERESGSSTLTPLASLLRTQTSTGGRGGALRISLLLTLIWINARPPYSTSRVAAYWAELLGRDDPRGDGARAVRDALHELADRDFIELRSSGARTTITLRNETTPLDEEGAPVPYEPPYSKDAYLQVPRAFWSDGLAGDLSGAGVAMYLCALALTRSDDPEFFISAGYFEDRYGISRSSRKRGLTELVEHGVLTFTVEESIDESTFRKVRRNVYRVVKKYRQPPAWNDPEAPQEDAARKLKRATSKTRQDVVQELVTQLLKQAKP